MREREGGREGERERPGGERGGHLGRLHGHIQGTLCPANHHHVLLFRLFVVRKLRRVHDFPLENRVLAWKCGQVRCVVHAGRDDDEVEVVGLRRLPGSGRGHCPPLVRQLLETRHLGVEFYEFVEPVAGGVPLNVLLHDLSLGEHARRHLGKRKVRKFIQLFRDLQAKADIVAGPYTPYSVRFFKRRHVVAMGAKDVSRLQPCNPGTDNRNLLGRLRGDGEVGDYTPRVGAGHRKHAVHQHRLYLI